MIDATKHSDEPEHAVVTVTTKDGTFTFPKAKVILQCGQWEATLPTGAVGDWAQILTDYSMAAQFERDEHGRVFYYRTTKDETLDAFRGTFRRTTP